MYCISYSFKVIVTLVLSYNGNDAQFCLAGIF